jgi:myo-inositol-1(or 4)-monophosphatase
VPAEPSPDALLAVATEVAAEAVSVLEEGLHRPRLAVESKSSPTDLVTEIDRAAETVIRRGLRRARPDDAIIGEEGTNDPGTSGVRWLVDPIDGTANYLYGHPGFAVSIAAVWHDTTLAGVVAAPVLNEVFTAAAGGGARRNGEAIRAGNEADPARALVATGFSYDPERRRRQAGVLTEVLPRVRDIRRMGAASTDLCGVACGRVDAYYERGLQPWDHAAGALVATEAGARVAGLDGSAPSSEVVLAANPALWPHLAALLGPAGAGEA